MPKIELNGFEVVAILHSIAEGMLANMQSGTVEVDKKAEEDRHVKFLVEAGTPPTRARMIAELDITMDLVFSDPAEEQKVGFVNMAPSSYQLQ